MLATIVGSAKGRSMSALTKALPGNSSRTSTHATSVPKTALTSATAADTARVTRSAARAAGAVTAAKNSPGPAETERTVRAASGSSTMRLSHSPTTPTPTPRQPVVRVGCPRRDGRSVSAGAGAGELGPGGCTV